MATYLSKRVRIPEARIFPPAGKGAIWRKLRMLVLIILVLPQRGQLPR
jgi:hypothetical protein